MGRPLRTYQHMYPAHEACVASATEQLGSTRFGAAFARGAAFSVDDAIAYALDELSSPLAPASSQPEPVLTARELEIAELIAQALSNKQIASRLTISVRTVEAHAQNILTKLGFRSRTQIAAWVTQQQAAGRTPPPSGRAR